MAARRFIERRALLAALLGACASAHAWEDGAPPGHTGGFGEPDCTACHSDNEKNASAGFLGIEGLPAHYAPGERYTLIIVLEHPELSAGGFQLAVRTAAGRPAGRLASPTGRAQLVTAGGQTYAEHSPEGRKPEAQGAIRWRLEWQAPEDRAPLVLHLAANAANDDLSALGDFIHTLERKIEPEEEPRREKAPRVSGEQDEPEVFVDPASTTREPAVTRFPNYPPLARRDRIEGEATVCFKIAPGGRVLEPVIESSTHKIFEKPALQAIRESSFEPLGPGEELSAAPVCRTYRFRLDPVEPPGEV